MRRLLRGWWRGRLEGRGGCRIGGLQRGCGLGEGVVGGGRGLLVGFIQGLAFQLVGQVQEVGSGLLSVIAGRQGCGVGVLQLLRSRSVGVRIERRIAFSLKNVVSRVGVATNTAGCVVTIISIIVCASRTMRNSGGVEVEYERRFAIAVARLAVGRIALRRSENLLRRRING